MIVGCSNQKSQDTSFIGTSSIQTTDTSTSVTKTTTLAPTTLAPTTIVSTTLAPTTLAPTTIAPTTVVPTLTTIIPTTSVSTTTHTHTYSTDWTNDATNHWHECSCGEKSEITTHKYGEWIITKEATHTDTGSKKQVCSVCGYEIVEEIPAIGHDYSDNWTNDATNHWHECSCGEKSEVAAHKYGEWIVTKEATHNVTGSKKQVCSACGYENVEEIPAIGHNYSELWNYNDSSHWHECSCTDKSETASHSFVAGICSVCGYKEGSQGLEYILSSNKDSYYVKGIGECTDTDIVIPEYYNGLKITNINSSAFKGNTEIKSVFISKNVSLISGEAFSNCRNLENVVFEEGVTNIAWYAFINCTSLKNVSLPSSLGIIGSNAFKNCTSLTNINIPDKVTALYGTFYGCSSLQNITLSKNLSIIDDKTFYGCSKLTEIVLPKSITKIGSYSLYTYDSIVIYYEGDLESWNKIEILEDSKIEPELIYFYSETQPSDEGNYWHYDIDGLTPLQW